MVSSFTLKTDELDNNFLATIKKLFAGKEIEITIQDSQTDTDYLLKNPVNKAHLLSSISSLEKNENIKVFSGDDFWTIIFSEESFSDYHSWAFEDKKFYKKINELIKDIIRSPFSGIGKPEPLKYELSGYWSRRINEEHRLVYKVIDNSIFIASCKYHY